MAYYSNPCLYLDDCADLKAKIERYDALISAMVSAAEKSALSGDIDEYSLDDGQTKIRNIYRNPNDILKAVNSLEKIRQIYVNRLNGRGVILKDRNSLRNC